MGDQDHLRCQRDFTSHVLKAWFTKGLSPVVFLAVFVEETTELIEPMDDTLKNIEKRKLNILWHTHAIIEHLPGGKMSTNF